MGDELLDLVVERVRFDPAVVVVALGISLTIILIDRRVHTSSPRSRHIKRKLQKGWLWRVHPLLPIAIAFPLVVLFDGPLQLSWAFGRRCCSRR